MKKIFLLIDAVDSRIKKSTLEIISHLRECFGNGSVIDGYSPEVIEQGQMDILKKYAVNRVYVPSEKTDISSFDHHRAVLNDLICDDYDCYIGSSSDWNSILLSSIAFSKDCDFYENCIGLVKEDNILLKKPFYGDKIISDIEVKQPFAASFRQKSFQISEPSCSEKEPEVIPYSIVLPSIEWIFEGLDNIEDAYEKKIDVKEAEVVISVGRGIQDKEKINCIDELIGIFEGKACLGASRVVVDQGWASFSNQVGQTGKIVSPTLYIALGISGAVQHQVGMNPSKYIIAVNKDPEAPIFEVADYGVVDDLFEFLPPFIEELKKTKCE